MKLGTRMALATQDDDAALAIARAELARAEAEAAELRERIADMVRVIDLRDRVSA